VGSMRRRELISILGGAIGPLRMQLSMKIRRSVLIGISIFIGAAAWALPFEAPMIWSYWVSGIWFAILIAAIASYGKGGLWFALGAPLALWHSAFAALIYIGWR
jgi:hypothetical protein